MLSSCLPDNSELPPVPVSYTHLESMGVKGWIAFEKTVSYIKENYPDQFIIADAKRGDIGNTSAMYALSLIHI